MPISEGTQFPSIKAKIYRSGKIEEVELSDLFANKKVALFGVPGAFTPTCDKQHLPGFVELYPKFKSKGIDLIVCHAVNDIFVMEAWAKAHSAGDKVIMLADGSAEITKKIGMEFDLTGAGLGMRCQRYAMVIENGKVKSVKVDPPKEFCDTSAEKVLELL